MRLCSLGAVAMNNGRQATNNGIVPMFDKDTLSQLKTLKKEIESAKEFAEGTVKGTDRRFGFVVLEDGREIFLAPAEMDKVLPGDLVKIQIHTDKEGKVSGELIKLLESPLTHFTGRYQVKGKGHFVAPDLPRLKRWLFIPPAARKNAKPGDFIACKLTRHPYPSGKAQATITEVIGNPEQPGIEASYISHKLDLIKPWQENWEQEVQYIDLTTRKDLTDMDFVTIDAEYTEDIDDALAIKATDDGWQLSVAIADPSAFFSPDSGIDQEARRRATSLYLPGKKIPMLPEKLATNFCSLQAGEIRPALVCQMTINSQGNVTDFSLLESSIRSKAKLSYNEVTTVLENTDSDHPHAELILTLKSACRALHQFREEENLIVPSRPEFVLRLNDKGKIDRIDPLVKTAAHQLVEECMIVANRCAAAFMGEKGLFHGHAGFRPERLSGVNKLVAEQLQLVDKDFSSLEGYRELINSINDEALEFPLRSVLSRMLERGRLSLEPKPHFGMGLEQYTTFTSPIRKYSDLYVHRLIKQQLRSDAEPQAINEDQLEVLQASLDKARQARFQVEQWLKCEFLQGREGQEATGVVSQINSNGFSVRLDDCGIEGFVDTRLIKEKYSFDPLRLRLTSKSLQVELDQAITIVIDKLDPAQFSINFTLPKAAETA